MKKINLFIVLLSITTITFAQKHNIVNASIALRNENYAEAKQYIDEAYNNESTSNEPKMWMYRAKIYKMIALNHESLDSDAIFKATESHLKCMQPHPKKKNKIIIYKKWGKEEVFLGLMQCSNKLFNLAVEAYQEGKFQESLNFYEPIYDVMALDDEGQLKSIKITIESLLHNSYLSARGMKNNELAKDFLQRLMDINSEKPSIYSSMSNIYFEEGNSEKALEYMALGRGIFKSDQGLITDEINLYIKLEKTEELIGKLGEAIALDEENDLLYFNRGTIYDQQGEMANAIKDYKAALAINPSSFDANYNLGALYFNTAIERNNKANATSNNSIYKKLKKEADGLFAKALPYLEEAYALDSKDKNTLLSLKQLYYMNEDYAKSEAMKKEIADLDQLIEETK